MSKNMYSLMLMDEVVTAIDKIASANHTNRSNLVNQILADYVSLITPQKRMKDIFDSIAALLIDDEQSLQVQSMSTDSVICIKSALAYKYRPTIRYLVELHSESTSLGELKVTFRTQSSTLLMEITHFLNLWMRLEEHYIHQFDTENEISYSLEQGRFRRTFMYPVSSSLHTNEDISSAIAVYIQMFDEILKGYLSGAYETDRDIEYRYLAYLENGLIII
jgi:hypothetical protein